MPLKVTTLTSAVREPLTLEELKPHLRLELGYTEEDDVLKSMIGAAREYAESYTRRKFIKQRIRYFQNWWSTGDCITLPFAPFSTGSTGNGTLTTTGDGNSAYISYKNQDSSFVTFASSNWVSDSVSEPGRLCLDTNGDWPSVTLHRVNPVRVTYTVGYSSGSSGVPVPIRSALKLIIGDLYENREGSISNQYVSEVNMGIKALLNPFRVFDGI